jgi:hypothetical protein
MQKNPQAWQELQKLLSFLPGLTLRRSLATAWSPELVIVETVGESGA